VFKAVAEQVADIAGNFVFDAHTAVLVREHGITRICTGDRHFGRFAFLEVIDPLS
jgi:predicted nucleic acid-binding protein